MSARKPKYCLQCDDGTELELKIKDVTVRANGVTRVVPDVAGKLGTLPSFMRLIAGGFKIFPARVGRRAGATGTGFGGGDPWLFAPGLEAEIHLPRGAGRVVDLPGGDQQTGGTLGAVV